MKIKKISVHAYDQHLVKPIDDLSEFSDLRQKLIALAFSNRDECLKGLYNLDFKTATSADLVREENIAFIFDGTASIINPNAVKAVQLSIVYGLTLSIEQVLSFEALRHSHEVREVIEERNEELIFKAFMDFYAQNPNLPEMFYPQPTKEQLHFSHTLIDSIMQRMVQSVSQITFHEFVFPDYDYGVVENKKSIIFDRR